MPFIVPGLGFAGLGQQTRAAQLVFQQAAGRAGARRTSGTGKKRRRARAAARPAKRRAASSRSRSKPARLVKGSAAAKRYMAKIRRKRK